MVVVVSLLDAVPALAATTAVVTILGIPAFTAGITSFTVTYVSDTEMDLNWTVGAGVENVMVRAKYGTPPTNPPDINTAPSDGYLVYYGSDLSAVDTSMDMNQNAGTLNYTAWAQKLDGTWNLVPKTNSQESREVVLIALLGLSGGLSFFAIKGKNILLAVLASISWLIVFAYNQSTPIAGFIKGSSGDTFVEVLLIGLMITIPLCAWSFRKNEKVKEERENVDWNTKQADRKAKPSYGELTDTSKGVDLLHMSDAEFTRVLQNSTRKNKR